MKVEKNEIQHRVERFKDTARQSGVRLTHQRLEIFREVAARLEHPSAEAVLRALHAHRIPASVKGLGSTVGTRVEVRGVCSRCSKEHVAKSHAKDPRAEQIRIAMREVKE